MEKKKNKRGFLFKLTLCIIIVSLLVVTVDIWLPLPARFLAVEDNIKEVDCIVPLQGDLFLRFEKAMELYNKGYAQNFVVSLEPKRDNLLEYDIFLLRLYEVKEVSLKEFILKVFKYFGKDATNIYFTDGEVTSTYEEALATRDLMLRKGYKSLILVTNTYYMRRALMIFESVFKGTGIKIYHCRAGSEFYNPDRWWRKERDVKMVANEYLSMAFNFFYHFLLKKQRTSFDS